MSDREDTSSLSAEEKIARVLEELGSRIDSQADRLTEQLAPVEKSVSAIEEQLRILGYERGDPAQPHERYRPRITPDTNPVSYEAPRPEEPVSEIDESDDVEFDTPEPTAEIPEPEAPSFETATPEATEIETPEPEAPALADREMEAPEPEQPEIVTPDIDAPEPEEPEPEEPEQVEPEREAPADFPVPESGNDDAPLRDAHNVEDHPGHDDTEIDAPDRADLPFENEVASDEDLNLANKTLKSDLEGLFDDGEYADRKPTPVDQGVTPTPFPTAPAPTRSRSIYLLVVALILLVASAGIGGFIWFELTSPELPFASKEGEPSETSTAATTPVTPPAPSPTATPTPTPTPTPTVAPTAAPEPPADTITAKPGISTPSQSTGDAPNETAELPRPQPAADTTSAKEPAETPSPAAAAPAEVKPRAEENTTPPGDVRTAEKPATTDNEFNKLLNLADAGDSDAQYKLAIRYLVGRGIEQDYEEAAKWLQEAAAGGVVSAQYNLGVLYDSGRGVEADAVEALIWFHSAAEKGHGRAQYALAAAYAAGRGIERDSDMALKWLRRAATENILEAQSSLANILATSPVSHDSLEEAYYWYRLADANGDGKAADKADLVAARLTPEERAGVNRRVSAFIASNITGKRQPTSSPAPPAPPSPPTAAPAKAAPSPGPTQAAATATGSASKTARVRTIQTLLNKLGFDTGPADGSMGAQTREAIRNYQRALGLDIDGEPSEALLAHLRQISGVKN